MEILSAEDQKLFQEALEAWKHDTEVPFAAEWDDEVGKFKVSYIDRVEYVSWEDAKKNPIIVDGMKFDARYLHVLAAVIASQIVVVDEAVVPSPLERMLMNLKDYEAIAVYKELPEPKRVRYRHFKGHMYEVIWDGVDEMGASVVIYRRVDPPDPTIRTRPYDEFHGMHESGVKRFVQVDDEEPARK